MAGRTPDPAINNTNTRYFKLHQASHTPDSLCLLISLFAFPSSSAICLSHPQLYHHHGIRSYVIPLYISMPSSWVNTKYSIYWAQHSLSTAYTVDSIHCVQRTPSTACTENSIHQIQYTLTTTYNLYRIHRWLVVIPSFSRLRDGPTRQLHPWAYLPAWLTSSRLISRRFEK